MYNFSSAINWLKVLLWVFLYVFLSYILSVQENTSAGLTCIYQVNIWFKLYFNCIDTIYTIRLKFSNFYLISKLQIGIKVK